MIEAINESENQFRLMADVSPVLIWKLNASGQSTYYNKTFREFTGISAIKDITDWSPIVHPDDIKLSIEKITEAIKERKTYRHEFRLLRADGQWRWVLAQANPIISEENEFLGLVGSSVDITENRDAEAILAKSEKRFENLIEESTVASALLEGPEWVLTLANKQMLEIWNRDETIFGKKLLNFMPELRGQAFPSLLDNVYQTGKTYVGEDALVVLERNGKLEDVYMDFTYKALRNADGEVYAILVSAADITDRYKGKKQLEESERKFQAAIAAVEGIIWTNNGVGEMEGEQPGWSKLTGQVYEEYKGFGWALKLHADDAAPTMAAWNDAVKHNKIFEFEHRVLTKENQWRLFSVKAVPTVNEHGKVYQWVGVHTDITDQRKIIDDIKESEERFQNLIYSSPSAIGILEGEDMVITMANEPIIVIWGKGKEIMGKKYFEALPELEDQGYKEVFANVYKTGIPFNAIETPVTLIQNGEETLKYYNFLLYPQKNIQNKVYGIGIIATEVTAQTLLSNKIKVSEERFRSLTQTLPQLIWMTDSQGKLEFASEKWYAFTGIQPGSEKEWELIVHPEDYKIINDVWRESLAAGKIYNFDVRVKNKVGEYKWHSVISEPVYDAENKIVKWVGAFTDNHTQKLFKQELELQVKNRTKELEEFNVELERKNKELQSFSYVASHDLQEPLRKIKTFASIIINNEMVNLSNKGKDYLEKMSLAANRMQVLIKDLLSFSGLSIIERSFERTDLNKMISEIKIELQELITEKNAEIEASAMPEVDLIAFQIQQLLQNLIINSLKFSIPNSTPKIMINGKIVTGKELDNKLLLPESRYFQLSVQDNGIGFEPKYADKIFDVFQRLHTQEKYKGTGIGLAIVKKIVENHNGIIIAKSELGKGALFNIYLPILL